MVAAETREKADPELPPITVVGHTDGVGGDDYNQTLSQERAEAVRDYLETELGTDMKVSRTVVREALLIAGIVAPETMNKARLSDEISIALAASGSITFRKAWNGVAPSM